MGLDRPELRRVARPALLAAARHGPRPDDDAVRRPAALGDVRGVGATRRRSTRSSPARRWPRRWEALASERYVVRLRRALHGAGAARLGGVRARGRPGRPAARRRRRRAAAGRPGGPVAILTRAADPPAPRASRSTARSPAARVDLLDAARACSPRSAIGEWPVAAPGDVLALARRSTTRTAYAYRRRRPPRRSCGAPAPRTGTREELFARFAPLRRRRGPGTGATRSPADALMPARAARDGARAERDERQPAAGVDGPADQPQARDAADARGPGGAAPRAGRAARAP